MNITKDQTIAGVPILTVRHLLRISGDDVWLRRAESVLGDGGNPSELLDVMVAEGYLEAPRQTCDGLSYEKTTAGYRLQNASAGKPLQRQAAQRALDGLFARIETIHADPRTRVNIDKVILFGSFLDETIERVSDVDLAISTVRVGPKVTQQQAADAYWRARGHGLPGPADVLLEYDVRKILKARKRALSLVEYRQHLEFLEKVPHKQIYPV